MGRKSSNVYDYFERIEPGTKENSSNRVRYECKRCKKHYAANATRLAGHLTQGGCWPQYKSNQKIMSVAPNLGPVVEQEVIDRLATVSTCAIADALSYMKIQGCLNTVSLMPGYEDKLSVNLCGPAHTVQLIPSRGAPGKKQLNCYIEAVPLGSVVVLGVPDGTMHSVWGGLMSTQAKEKGCAGVITNGRCRDVQDNCAMDFHVFASGTSPQGNKGDLLVSRVGDSVVLDGCVIRNNDVIRADINGVVIIPRDRASDVALRAELIEQQDEKIAAAVRAGESLSQVLPKYRLK